MSISLLASPLHFSSSHWRSIAYSWGPWAPRWRTRTRPGLGGGHRLRGQSVPRTMRWQIILRSVAAIPYRVVANALLVGYGLNTIMPARLGELFRAEFFKRSFGLSRVWPLTSIVIERLCDGLTVVACFGFWLLLTATTREGADIVLDVLATGGTVFGAILLAALYLSRSTVPRALSQFPGLSARIAMAQRGSRSCAHGGRWRSRSSP